MANWIKQCVFASLLLVSSVCASQAQDFVTLKWSGKTTYTFEPDSVERPFYFDGASFADGDPFPRYVTSIRLGDDYDGNDYDVVVEYPDYEPLPDWQQKRMEDLGLVLPPTLQVGHDIRTAGSDAYLVVRFVPMAYRDGRFCRIRSFRLRITETNTPSTKAKAAKSGREEYPDSSVLASGKWVKIAVTGSGVYSISFSRLASMGFTDPSKVAVYGYGGNLLHEDFTQAYCNDLPEVPVKRTANALLFYAEGNTRVDAVRDVRGDYWLPVTNYCSDYGYYFLTEKESPATFAQAPSLPRADETVTQFTDYVFYKGDEAFAWANFGRRFYDSYDFRNGRSRDYQFSLPGITSPSEARVDIAFAAGSSRTSSYLDVYNGGSRIARSTDMRVASSSQYIKAKRTVTTSRGLSVTDEGTTLRLVHSTDGNVSGHLEYVLINYPRRLELTGSTLLFGTTNATGRQTYAIRYADSSTEVWDVTTPGAYRQMPLTIDGGYGYFTDDGTGRRRFVAVKTNAAVNEAITVVGEIANQNLHALRDVDMAIIIPADGTLYDTAERLAQWHRDADGMNVVTVTAGDIYNEFSSGTPDVTAYRRFMKMLYDTSSDKDKTKYLLLFGDAAFDNRMRTSTWSGYSPGQFLLSYQPSESENEQDNFLTDDYFGYLEDNEGANIPAARNTVDIGIGRLPVRTVSEASGVVDKLIAYMQNDEKGAWKNRLCWVADDNLDDGGTIHMEQCNEVIDSVELRHEGYLVERLFLDLYKRESSSTGYSYPQAEERLQTLFDRGMLVLSYIGHSNTDFWTSKRILTGNDVTKLNSPRLPLWLTASCDYTRFDAYSTSAGELAMLNARGGAVGLITTTRVVYISDNQRINLVYNRHLYDRKADGTHYTLGEIQMKTKQARAVSGSEDKNDLNFILLGDPALRLAYPDANKVIVDSINGIAPGSDATVQMKAGSITKVKGHVETYGGSRLAGFDGKITTTAMDSRKLVTTLNNAGYVYDDGPDTIQFMARTNTLFIGNDSVRGGEFEMQFAVPLDINYSNDSGLLSFYAWNDSVEANAEFDDFIVGGAVEDVDTDGMGPDIYAYLNTPDFVYGGQVNESPVLYATFMDEDGMNISESGLGHNIVAIIDDDPNLTYVLNDYYTQTESYMRGNVVYKLPALAAGRHKMKIRAWDVFNNSSSTMLEFEVVNGLKPSLTEVNCISPATEQTTFFVTHDRPNSDVSVMLEVFDYAGGVLFKTEMEDRTGSGIYTYDWDLRDNAGASFKSGVYIYRVSMSAEGGEYESKAGKIVIVRQ